jgi:16S rRNA (uracil1498-N3)-methyltransferase
MINGKHKFAFFASWGVAKKVDHDIFPIKDETLSKRIFSVLRMSSGDELLLFDRETVACVTLTEVSKKRVLYQIISVEKTASVEPYITCLLPLLKQEALEQAITRLSVLGVFQIQLVVSEKSRQSLTQKEFDRLQKMITAAAEQSKQFAMPQLCDPKSFSDAIKTTESRHRFLFDQYGLSSRSVLQVKYSESIVVAFGPEGDFTDTEKQLCKDHDFQSLALTDSVLRTVDAVLLGVGLLRLA